MKYLATPNLLRGIAAVVLGCLLAAAGAAPARAGDPAAARLVPDRVYDHREVLAASLAEEPAAVPERPAEYKDPRLAMLYSLLLPGLGEMWLGHGTRAKFFFAAEAGIWTAYGVFQVQGNHRKDLYREYAQVFAGVPERGDEDFYRVIGNFASSDGPFSANEQVRRQARALYPNDRARQEQYVRENGYFGDDAWEWESEEALDRYREMRRSSLDAFNNADLTLGLLVANRLVSVVDAGLLAAKWNRSHAGGTETLSWDVGAGPEGPRATVMLARSF